MKPCELDNFLEVVQRFLKSGRNPDAFSTPQQQLLPLRQLPLKTPCPSSRPAGMVPSPTFVPPT